MNIRSWIRRIPFAIEVYKKITAPRRRLARKYILTQLEIHHCEQGLQIREALVALQKKLTKADQGWVIDIEAERSRLLKRHEPLVDSSLGEPGLYDTSSIREACLVSKPPEPALLLFLLTRALRAQNVIEIGTNVGISSAYIGAGQVACGRQGRVTTLDASPYRQRLAREVHRNLGLDNIAYVQGLFSDTLRTALTDLGSVDLAFIDGHHQYQPTLNYFEEILEFSTPDAVFVFDDIRWSEGMKKAWSRIQADDRLGLIVDLYSVGICTRRPSEDSQRFVSKPIQLF